ncbi:MAG: hypothetical protein HQ572_01165 [Candidatus Omnitrophica bacterium]|nr:hypothetical protein [Candidatus Omnitrophota bacterium]
MLPLGIITILIVSLTAIFLLKTRGTIIFPPQISTSISRVSTSPVDTSTTDTVLSAEQNRPKDESGFILTGVIHGGGAPMAVINGSVYMIGDSIEEAKIAEITDDKVVLENSGKRIELKVR